MKYRYKMNKRSSRKYFKKTADGTHRVNFRRPIMRGGIRF
jgi:hypothetical protein